MNELCCGHQAIVGSGKKQVQLLLRHFINKTHTITKRNRNRITNTGTNSDTYTDTNKIKITIWDTNRHRNANIITNMDTNSDKNGSTITIADTNTNAATQKVEGTKKCSCLSRRVSTAVGGKLEHELSFKVINCCKAPA